MSSSSKLLIISLLIAVAFAAEWIPDGSFIPSRESVAIPNSWIITFQKTVSDEAVAAHMAKISSLNMTIVHNYNIPYPGGRFTGYNAHMDESLVATVKADPNVAHVEQDATVWASQDTCDIQTGATWGISRVSVETLPNPLNTFRYHDVAAEEVDTYVIDTGIYIEHLDFGGRARYGWDTTVNPPRQDSPDRNGHGTHVASTMVGTAFGICKTCNAIAVKVLGDNGSGSFAGVIAGIDWVAAEARQSGRSSVSNLSLGGGRNEGVNQAVNAMVRAGVASAVASGNSNANACNFSPASAEDNICVGATTRADARSGFSNWGTCQDIWAPGSDVTGAWVGNPSAIRTISGTSMAAPHVAGALGVYMEANPSATGEQAQQAIIEAGSRDLINGGGINNSPNILVHQPCN